MQYSQQANNLKMFLDPGERTPLDKWFFGDDKTLARAEIDQLLMDETICVFRFSKQSIWRYAVLLWRLMWSQNIIIRKVLFKSDGLLSCFFELKDASLYRLFRRAHLPESRGLKSRLVNFLPLAVRADALFLVASLQGVFDERWMVDVSSEFEHLNFMFYSNADGKLLLLDGKSFHNGSGLVVKTTTNQQYSNILAKEFETLQHVHDHTDKSGVTPEPIKHIHGKRHDYFIENYIGGRSLREILRDPKTCANKISVCALIDRLDVWFAIYCKGFRGGQKPFQELYRPLFNSLRLVYSDNPELNLLIDDIWQQLVLFDRKHPGLVPVIAHNDLWPGNFIVTSDRLVAVDWERATADRSELFDYFWLIISAVLEYQVGITGIQDYAAGFRSFLDDHDPVCGHARDKIISRLARNNISKDMKNLFFTLFLLEWSVQGWLVLKRQTDMDKLALGELLQFIKRTFSPLN